MPLNVARPTDAAYDEIHADWWDEDEVVRLKPVKTFQMQQRAQMRASVMPEGYTPEELRKMSEAELAKLELYDPGRMQDSLFRDMLVGWTLRYPPTEEQEAAGERGDLIPFDPTMAFPERDGRFIADEIAKRGQGRATRAVNARGQDFREPTA